MHFPVPSSEDHTKPWLLASWSETNLKCALALVQTTPGLADPDFVVMLVDVFVNILICACCFNNKRERALVDVKTLLRLKSAAFLTIAIILSSAH